MSGVLVVFAAEVGYSLRQRTHILAQFIVL